jgi:SPP1 gp7 family putative phage head morphogenesis protein
MDADLGPDESASTVWLVAQRSKGTGYRTHDEHKAMLGFASREDAIAAYLVHRDDPRALGNVVEMTMDEFRRRSTSRAPVPGPFRHDASETDRARDLVDQVRSYMDRQLSPAYLESLAKKMGVRLADVNLEELRRQTRSALGVALQSPDKSLGALLDHFAHENASNIKSLSAEETNTIEKIVMRAISSGTPHQQVAEKIQQRLGITERKARFIARDQLGSLYGQIARSRHRELGVTRYVQRTVGDGKVRPLHRRYQAESLAHPFSYDDPPEDGIPGEAYGCRCAGEPVFDEVIDAINIADAA